MNLETIVRYIHKPCNLFCVFCNISQIREETVSLFDFRCLLLYLKCRRILHLLRFSMLQAVTNLTTSVWLDVTLGGFTVWEAKLLLLLSLSHMKVPYHRDFMYCWGSRAKSWAGLSVRRSGFNPRVVFVGCAMERWHHWRLYSENFVCLLLIPIPIPPILHTYLSPGAGVICPCEARV